MGGADIAEQVDDLICVMDKVVGSQADTIVILLVGWLLFGGVIFLVSHLIYSTISTEAGPAVISSIPLVSVSPPCDLPHVAGQDQNHINYIKARTVRRDPGYNSPLSGADDLARLQRGECEGGAAGDLETSAGPVRQAAQSGGER